MNNTDEFKIFLTMFLVYLPTFIVCLAAGLVILTRWQEASTGSMWALLGFGLALILCLVMPAGQAMLQQWVFQDGQRASRMWAFTTFSMVGSVLHAAIYVLLLVAIFAGRPKSGGAMPPAMNRPS